MGQPREGTGPGRVELTEEGDDHAMVRTADDSGTDIPIPLGCNPLCSPQSDLP